MLLAKAFSHPHWPVGSELLVGGIAAATTFSDNLIVSCITIAVSIVLTGLMNHYLARSSDRKASSEATRFHEMAEGEHLKNISRVVALKEQENETLLRQVEALRKDVAELREEVDRLRQENKRLMAAQRVSP